MGGNERKHDVGGFLGVGFGVHEFSSSRLIFVIFMSFGWRLHESLTSMISLFLFNPCANLAIAVLFFFEACFYHLFVANGHYGRWVR